MKLAVKTATARKMPEVKSKRIGGRSFEANVSFTFIQSGQRLGATIEVMVPASSLLSALGRAGRLAMPLLRKKYPDAKIKLKELSVEIAEVS